MLLFAVAAARQTESKWQRATKLGYASLVLSVLGIFVFFVVLISLLLQQRHSMVHGGL